MVMGGVYNPDDILLWATDGEINNLKKIGNYKGDDYPIKDPNGPVPGGGKNTAPSMPKSKPPATNPNPPPPVK